MFSGAFTLSINQPRKTADKNDKKVRREAPVYGRNPRTVRITVVSRHSPRNVRTYSSKRRGTEPDDKVNDFKVTHSLEYSTNVEVTDHIAIGA